MKKLVVFFFLFLIIDSWSQEISQDFQFVNFKKDIPNVGVSSIIQDNDGFIWIGTLGVGVFRFDGVNYKSYKHVLKDSTSLSSSKIESVYLDHRNNLWVGTENGLNIYNKDLDRFKRIKLDNDQQELSREYISAIISDGLNSLFVNTLDAIYRINLDTFDIDKVENSSERINNQIYIKSSIIRTNQGRIFVGTIFGLKEIDLRNNRLINARLSNEGSELLESSIESLYVDNSGDIWIGTIFNGVVKLTTNAAGDVLKVERFTFSTKKIMAIIQLSDDTLVIGTENDGLFHIKEDGTVIKNYRYNSQDENSIRHNSIWSLMLDREERIWLGYYNSGVAVSDNLYDKFNQITSVSNNKNSLKFGSVMAIVEDNKEWLWIATDGGGIDIYNPKDKNFIHINSEDKSQYLGLTSDYIIALFKDKNQNIYAGSWDKGLFVLNNNETKFVNYNTENTLDKLKSNAVTCITEDSKGIIWIGTFFNGLHSFNPKTKVFKNYDSKVFADNDLVNVDIRTIYVDSENFIWVGTPYGLYKLEVLPNEAFKITSLKDSMTEEFKNPSNANYILSIYESSDKNIWIGTRGAGLCKYDKTNDKYTWFNKLNGLNEENISAIIESKKDDLWVSGNSGLTNINLDQNTIKNYNYSDGLLSNDFNFNSRLKDKSGNIYFGNFKGIDFFNPNDIKINNYPPSVYIKDFKIYNKKVIPNSEDSPLKKVISQTNNIVLNSNQTVFTIDYSTISYTRPDNNSYAYYLEGLEENWNYVGNARSITYTNLDEGRYIFNLKAANNDGIWNETPVKLNIEILPPWWRTNRAIAIYLLLFFTAIYLLNKLTLSRVKEKQLIRNERIQRNQQDELNSKKIQFFTNISHEFRTPLTLIINPLKDIINNKDLNLPLEVINKHKIIYKNTNRLYRLINELMDFRKLELNKLNVRAQKINLKSFIGEILEYFREEAQNKHIFLSLDADVSDVTVWADENMLEKIIFNLVSNAVKVTPSGGAISISVLSTGELFNLPFVDPYNLVEAVEIFVTDTGPGLQQEEIDKIFDRFYQVEKLNKTYYGGTGIGLEVVKSFVELHKGKIEVKSDLGKGTEFRILIPTGKSHFEKDQIIDLNKVDLDENEGLFVDMPELQIYNNEVSNSTNLHTLLIIEDNAEMLEYLKYELQNQYKIVTANNGKEGLDIAKETLPDVVITDVIMPKMNGFEFCKLLKSDSRISHIPVLMLSAKSRIEDKIEGAQIGADAYMTKPFDLQLLKLRLAQLINSRKVIFEKYFSDISGANDEFLNSTSLDKEFIQKLFGYINDNLSDSNLSVELLASKLNLSRSQLYRKIKAITGQTVNELIRKIRLERAKQILENGKANVSEVCYKVGFSSPSYFTKCFKANFGILPTEVESKV